MKKRKEALTKKLGLRMLVMVGGWLMPEVLKRGLRVPFGV